MRSSLRRCDILWLLLVGLILAGWQVTYLGRPGQPADAPRFLPEGVVPGKDGTLVVFLHPQCPCSKATLAQVVSALQDAGSSGLATYLVFLQPEGASADFHRSSLWDKAQTLSDVLLVIDEKGRLSRAFGAATSGQALYYNASGDLGFAGGLTTARGHEGPSLGLDALLAVLREQQAPTPAPVYGCPLWEDTCNP